MFQTNTEGSSATAVVDLRTPAGQSLGTQTVTIPARGLVEVADLTRTLLSWGRC